jgi:hypothetical protein
MSEIFDFFKIRNQKIAEKAKKIENETMPNKLKKIINICAVHGEVKIPLRFRGIDDKDEVYCALCLADFMDTNNIGKTKKVQNEL